MNILLFVIFQNKLAPPQNICYLLPMNSPLVFEYALKFPNGKYYTGRVNSEALPDYWQGDKREAFTYTLEGAHKKKDSLACFSSCVVEKIL